MKTVQLRRNCVKFCAIIVAAFVLCYPFVFAPPRQTRSPGSPDANVGKKTAGFDQNAVQKDYYSQNNSQTNGTAVWEVAGYEQCRTTRLKRLRQRCYNSGYRPYQPYESIPEKELREMVKNVIVDTKHRVLVQTIAKTGSGSWRDIIMKSTNKKTKYDLEYLNKVESISDVHQYLYNYFFLLTVRHPITRLQSAFENKFLQYMPDYLRRHGLVIINRYRKLNKKYSKDMPESELRNITRPTFDEYITYVLDRKSRAMDQHWDTYEESSHPCAFDFSYIAKTETVEFDMEYVTRTQLSKSMHAHRNESPPKESELAYFDRLPNKAEVMSKIKEIYSIDMKLFGYTLSMDPRTGQFKPGCEEYGPADLCC